VIDQRKAAEASRQIQERDVNWRRPTGRNFRSSSLAYKMLIGDFCALFSPNPNQDQKGIIPADLLNRSELAINFHPGSRDYPGSGCYSFAIYDRAAEYGCVCHHMVSAVDTGPLIEERRFRTIENETVETLKFRTYVVMQALLQDISLPASQG
jgi:Formyl transferase